MKATRAICAAASAAIALALAGCSPSVGTFSNSLGGTQATETTAMSAESTTLKSNNATALTVSVSGVSALVNAAGQVVTLDFNAVPDSDTIDSAVAFYPLSNAADNYTRAVRGTALKYTKTVQGQRAFLSLDASSSSTAVELFIDATKLTGNGGIMKLGSDGNKAFGEASDSLVQYLTVGTAPGASAPTAVTTGAQINPQAKVSFALSGLLSANAVIPVASYGTPATNVFSVTVSDTGSAAAPNNHKVSFNDGAIAVYKNVDGAWKAESGAKLSLDATTGIASLAGVTFSAGDSVKIVVDKYNIVESQSVLDYVHRASYRSDFGDPLADTGNGRYFVKYFSFSKGATTSETLAATKGGSNGTCYIDLALATGTTPIDPDKVSANSVKVRLGSTSTFVDGTAVPAGYYATYTSIVAAVQVFETNAKAVKTLRLYLPSNIGSISGQVEIAPSVLSVSSTTDALSLMTFGEVGINATNLDGWAKAAF